METGVLTGQEGNPYALKLHPPRKDEIEGWKCSVNQEKRQRGSEWDDEDEM